MSGDAIRLAAGQIELLNTVLATQLELLATFDRTLRAFAPDHDHGTSEYLISGQTVLHDSRQFVADLLEDAAA